MDPQHDFQAIYRRGLNDFASLRGVERLVFLLEDFDILMEMEGWDHFYLYEHHFARYPEMREWLAAIGDQESLAVLDDYERHLNERGVPLSPGAVAAFLEAQGVTYLESCPDWRERYTDLRETRWRKALAYIESSAS